MPAETLEAPETSVELLREFERTGRPEPFETFMRRHASMVYATCLKVTRDPHDAEDATQATFLTLASKSRLNGEIRQPEAWLRKVAHRLSLDLIRSKKRRVNRENLRSEMTDEAAPLDSHEHADKGEVKGILNEELAKLPASYRMPLILHYFGGLSRDEMAEQLKLKPSTLGVRLHRAREQLRRKLAARGILLPTVALTALLTEVVRQGVCGHMMTSTAQQASAIALGHAAAPQMFAASTGVDSIGSLLSMLSHGKLKVMLSALVVTAAISVTSGQITKLLPAAIRDWLPTLQMPSLPKLQFKSPLPALSSATPANEPPAADSAGSRFAARMMLEFARPVALMADRSEIPSTVRHVAKPTVGPLPAAPTPSPAVAVAVVPDTVVRRVMNTPLPSRAPLTFTPSAVAASVAPRVTTSSRSDELDAAHTSSAAAADAWTGVIADRDGSANPFTSAPSASDASGDVPADVPSHVVASVTGAVPALQNSSGGSAGGGGGGGGSGHSASSGSVRSSGGATAQSHLVTRTVIFNGTTPNYGGYSDASWKPTEFTNLDAVAPNPAVDPSSTFNYPAVPGSTLSLNGARVTLHGTTKEGAASVTFVDTTSALIPTLPDKHHFIGVWELATDNTYDTADLLVRYDDLRAARLGLNERILKLWVSDGVDWKLMWLDPSFGRDINQNLLWVTAPSEIKFFAVSAPEPASLVTLLGAIGVLARRRRRVG